MERSFSKCITQVGTPIQIIPRHSLEECIEGVGCLFCVKLTQWWRTMTEVNSFVQYLHGVTGDYRLQRSLLFNDKILAILYLLVLFSIKNSILRMGPFLAAPPPKKKKLTVQ